MAYATKTLLEAANERLQPFNIEITLGALSVKKAWKLVTTNEIDLVGEEVLSDGSIEAVFTATNTLTNEIVAQSSKWALLVNFLHREMGDRCPISRIGEFNP